MNLGTLRPAVRERLLMTATDAAGGDATVNGYINEALHVIETENPGGWDWLRVPFNFSTVAGTERYTLAAIAAGSAVAIAGGIHAIVSAERLIPGSTSGPFPMIRQPRRQAQELYPFTLTQPPEVYYVEGLALGLKPIPDAVYTISGIALAIEPDLVADGNTPILPAMFHAAIIEKAAALLARRTQNAGKAAECESFYKEWVGRMRRYRPYTGPGRVSAPASWDRY